ncbi:unnamed protein product [Microthlaspi erraticum]|uniref:Shugoshin C-terminal domain-containing protein n=1 Tax=Microthlaspi erraticum TaxID=1685480 RepID=A0A6D2J4B9_9BRAS|nr:unnamed protein product [Microthlaspi erraticum]
MNSVTVIEVDNSPAQEVPPTPKGNGKMSVLESYMSSAQRRKLGDISNLQGQAKQMNREETHQQLDMLFSSKEYAEKLQKENMTLMKALAHRNKIIELSGVEFQKLRINLRNVQEKNLQLAQANSHMLAELNTSRDRLKLLQHELCCKNVLLEARKVQLEEQELPPTHHPSKDKVHDMNHKDTKRKRTSRIKPSECSNVKPIQIKENANSKRKVSGVIDTTAIPEVTCQTEDDIEKGVVVSQGTNQIIDHIVNKKFVPDAVNPVKDSVHSKRQCVRRKSTRFDVPVTDQTEKLLEMDDAKETKETARLSLRRRSARLRPEEAEPCKSYQESDEVRETIKTRRVSSILQSSKSDFQEPEVTETLNADDAGSLVSQGSRSEVVEPSETRHDTTDTNGKRRFVSDIIERESKTRAEESEGVMRRTSVGRRPSRHAADKVQSYREVSLKAKMRRDC